MDDINEIKIICYKIHTLETPKENILYILKKYKEDGFYIPDLIYKRIEEEVGYITYRYRYDPIIYLECTYGPNYISIIPEEWVKWKGYTNIVEI